MLAHLSIKSNTGNYVINYGNLVEITENNEIKSIFKHSSFEMIEFINICHLSWSRIQNCCQLAISSLNTYFFHLVVFSESTIELYFSASTLKMNSLNIQWLLAWCRINCLWRQFNLYHCILVFNEKLHHFKQTVWLQSKSFLFSLFDWEFFSSYNYYTKTVKWILSENDDGDLWTDFILKSHLIPMQ